jgi:hypothetical protein
MARRRRRRRTSAAEVATVTYAELRRLNPAAAREKLLEAHARLHSIRAVARAFHTTRNIVRKALRRFRVGGPGGLDDLSRRPHTSPTQTSAALETVAVQMRKRTGYGPVRLKRHGVPLPVGTIRNIIRRYRLKPKRCRTWKRTRRNMYLWEEKEPLSFFQTDLKEILDRKGIPPEAYAHHEHVGLPPYQWTACCVRTRTRFLAYSTEKTFANGLAFMVLVILWLRAHGLRHHISHQTDWGEEFGGKSPKKLAALDRRIFQPLGASLLRIRKGRKTDNAIVERSHRSDDEEYYAPLLTRYPSTDAFLLGSYRWQCHWNLRRPHSGHFMYGKRPFDRARELLPSLTRDVALFPPLLLDRVGPLPPLLADHLPLTLDPEEGPDVPAHYTCAPAQDGSALGAGAPRRRPGAGLSASSGRWGADGGQTWTGVRALRPQP